MNINNLIKLADHLDANGHHKEASYIDSALRKAAFPWLLFLTELLWPSSTATNDTGDNCVDWPLEKANEMLDLEQFVTSRNISSFPEKVRELIEKYRDCWTWDYNLSDEENEAVKSTQSLKFAFEVHLRRLIMSDPDTYNISHEKKAIEAREAERARRAAAREAIGTSINPSIYEGPEGFERAKEDWGNLSHNLRISAGRDLAQGTAWTNITEDPPDDMLVEALLHAQRKSETDLVNTYGKGIAEGSY